ncbi:MAG: alpha/beta hydrolase [Burkholderiaceae bacterium]
MSRPNSLPATMDSGAGDTALFLLHGVGGGKQVWRDNLPAWAEAGYRTVAWDMPGYGDSDTIAPYTTAALAQSLNDLILHIGARRNVLVGHSMGGMVAQELVAAHPGIVHGLVLSGTSPAFGRPGGNWQQQFLRERFAPLDAGQSMAQLAAQLVPTMMAPLAEPQALAMAQAVMAAVPQASYRAALQAIVAFDRREDLAHIAVPTLCLAGEHDRNAAPEVVRRMAAHIASAQFLSLPAVGHLANMEKPDAFNTAVLAFLRAHFPV